jgi:hypothetical protein
VSATASWCIGTGYLYTPWVGTVWYGSAVTYGFGVSVAYTPWTGWAYGAGFGWSAYAPRPYYVPPYAAAVVGPYGAAVGRRGPGGWAATTGNVYSQWGSSSAVRRTSGGYNAWTGNAWASQAGTSYNSRTGVASAGQRAGVPERVHGQLHRRRARRRPGARGRHRRGRPGHGGERRDRPLGHRGRGVAYDPNTGNATSVAGVHGAEAGVGRVGNDVYAGKDGNVYRHGSDGWQQYENGGWQSVRDGERAHSLEKERSARTTARDGSRATGRPTRMDRAGPAHRAGLAPGAARARIDSHDHQLRRSGSQDLLRGWSSSTPAKACRSSRTATTTSSRQGESAYGRTANSTDDDGLTR